MSRRIPIAIAAVSVAVAAALVWGVPQGHGKTVNSPAARAETPTVAVVPSWRGMFREYLRLRNLPLPEKAAADWQKLSPALSPQMRELGEAFARAAYAKDLTQGRRNYHQLVVQLGMTHPKEGDLRQFLHPNKKPWESYAGATDGNFHILFNTGTLNLDPADGSSKIHPVKALARKHLGFFTTQAHVKKLTQNLTATLRAECADTATLCADAAKRAELLGKCAAAWLLRDPKNSPLSRSELAFLAAILPYLA